MCLVFFILTIISIDLSDGCRDADLSGWLASGGHEQEGILKERLCSLDEGLLSVDKSRSGAER